MDHEMATVELVDTFDIDDGELAGLSVQESFVLGVEWMRVRTMLVGDLWPFSQTIHTANAERLTALATKYGRFCEHHKTTVEGWSVIHVGGRK